MRKAVRKLQSQLLLLLILSTIIPLFIVGGYSLYTSSNTLSELSFTKLDYQFVQKADKIKAMLAEIENDVLLLSQLPPMQGIIRARSGGGFDKQGNSSYAQWVERLNSIFKSTIQAKKYYMHLRYLDEKGNEMVRVDSDSRNITVVPQAEMPNKSDRSYFRETMKLGLGELYISPLELNRERGVIERPYKPVLRYATPIFDPNGKRKGIAIANVLASKLIDDIANLNKDPQTIGAIVNQDGYYIYHPDSPKEWGFELNTNKRLERDYPPEVVRQILSGKTGHIVGSQKYLINYYTVVLNPATGASLVVVYQTPKDVVFASLNQFKTFVGLAIFLSLAAVLPLGIVRVRRLVQSVKQLVNGISTFSLEIMTTLDQQDRIAASQSQSVNEITTTISDANAAQEQTAQQAENVANGAREALTLAEAGARSISKTLEGLLLLQDKVAVISRASKGLGAQTSQIGNISSLAAVLRDLANQTNMLALNAAVEAVRAGDRGKGFGVVAAEIRQLADRSRLAAENINNMLPQIQTAIKNTVQATHEASQTLESGLAIARETANTFSGVRTAANSVFISNQQISLNAKRQAAAMLMVAQEMNAINHGAAEIATGISYAQTGVQQINYQALNLKEIV
ncbi:MAG: methyl-accepting chemotaxis protein [Hormoscilla sp.]